MQFDQHPLNPIFPTFLYTKSPQAQTKSVNKFCQAYFWDDVLGVKGKVFAGGSMALRCPWQSMHAIQFYVKLLTQPSKQIALIRGSGSHTTRAQRT